jgi:pimeloyl-ACP methyl ester carboxylesterase
VVAETDLALGDGRTLHVYDTGTGDGTIGLAVFWQHGTPSTGAPPEPLFAAAAERGIRWVSHDRPGYGGSTPHPGRDVASAAADVASIADALGIDRFAVMGDSGGGAHALACAAVWPGRVLATVCMSGPAPFGAEGLDWFAGMTPSGAAEYRAAVSGRAVLEAYFASAEFDPEVFTPADHAAAFGAWSWLGTVAAQALATDQGGIVDDDLAYVSSWGCDPSQISIPVLFVHGAQDRLVPSSHATWLAQRCRTAELWLRPDDGHVSILNSSVMALDWLREHARHR